MDDFETVKVLGQGSFGLAYLVTRKSDNMKLVLKQVNATESELIEVLIMLLILRQKFYQS